jgi:hypothetical protein
VGGPADIRDEQDWTILAYIDLDQKKVHVA